MTLGDLGLRIADALALGDLSLRVSAWAYQLGDLTVRTFNILLGGQRKYWRRRGRNMTASHRRF
jgi:hypothetical protein